MNPQAWTYLLGASAMEICWMLSLKYLDMSAIKSIKWSSFFATSEGALTLLPLLCYAVFGLANVYFISIAMKYIPLSIAFSIWFGIALIGSTLIDVFWFEENLNMKSYLFMAMIIGGVIGLKLSLKV